MSVLSFSSAADIADPAPTSRRWIDFLLISFMLVNLALSLEAADWSPGLDQLITIVGLASIAGTLVAISDFGAFFAFVYGVISGAAAILYALSSLATGAVLGQERTYQIIERTITWFNLAFSGQPGTDTLVFVLLLSILLWILSFNATWVYFREGRKWQAILPTGLAMLVNLYYAPHDLKAYFVLYLIAAMFLLLRAALAERELQWREEHIYFPFDIGFDVMRDGVIFILVVVTLSWVLPTALSKDNKDLVNPLESPWQQAQEEWRKLFSTLNYGNGGAAAPSVIFNASHPLGGARSSSDLPVMDVRTPLNRYYQATVLDTYTSQSWELRNTVGVNLVTSYPIPSPDYAARRVITQTVTMRQETNVVIGAPMPLAVSVPADARLIPQNLMPEEAIAAEVIGPSERALIISHDIIQPGQSYTVTSSVSFATESQLRSDSTAYAPDIRARYLQLPDATPQRVFDLAEQLAAGYDNPYDIAKAIETYVRGYAYNDQISGPKPGQDAADYFLFEEKQGYCDYYATSMAVMLRHLGIPARLAQGYATGEYDDFTGSYRLLEKDAHSWVEVYFPTYGWIQFEPTASEPVLKRQSESVLPPGPGGRVSVKDQQQHQQEENRNIPVPEETLPRANFTSPLGLWQQLSSSLGIMLLTLALAGLMIVGVLLWRLLRAPRPGARVRRRIRKPSQDFVETLWERLLWWARHLDVPQSASLTPQEQAAAFARVLPQVSDDVIALSQLYARDKYSPHPLQSDDLDRAQFTWLKLRSQFVRAWLNHRFQIIQRIRFWG